MKSVIVSGMHSSDNPSPGVGVARSLWSAWPALSVIALDYSPRSTGLNYPGFEQVLVHPPLGSVDQAAAVHNIVSLTIELNAWYISGLDLEARLISQAGDAHILSPPPQAFALTQKRDSQVVAALMGLQLPQTHVISDITEAAHTAESWGWRAWLKGPNYEALPCSDSLAFERAFVRLKATWGENPLLQEHISGREASFAFAALNGTLVEACEMEKREITSQGKTWSGRVRSCSPDERARLAEFCALTQWTGGGEIELVLPARGTTPYLIDINPRFPAWIHGATVAGINLPASLVAAAEQIALPVSPDLSTEFTRVVIEIPRTHVSTLRPEDVDPSTYLGGDSKGHPSEMPALARSVQSRDSIGQSGALATGLIPFAMNTLESDAVTPHVRFDRALLRDRVELLRQLLLAIGDEFDLPYSIAYSMKTNNSATILDMVRTQGCLIECISRAEVTRAIEAGFPASRVLLDGPGKWWPPSGAPLNVGAVFSDSPEDLARCIAKLQDATLNTQCVGLRVKAPFVPSRFGVDLTQLQHFDFVSRRLPIPAEAGVEIGMHFHLASSSVGHQAWLNNFVAALELFSACCSSAGVIPRVVDVGGGWPPGALPDSLRETLRAASSATVRLLGPETVMVIEPGKLLVKPAMTLVSRVLETRSVSGEIVAAIVDAGLGDLPDKTVPTRRAIWSKDGASWRELPTGHASIYGRLCVEADTIRTSVTLPPGLAAGDFIAFPEVGAYDQSMSYRFAD